MIILFITVEVDPLSHINIYNCSNDNTVHHSSSRPTITYIYIYNCSNDNTVHHSRGQPSIT